MLTLQEIGVEPEHADQSAAYVEVLRAVEQRRPLPGRAGWEAHWSGYDEPVPPAFLDHGTVFRCAGRFVTAPVDTEKRFFIELKRRLFREYLSDVEGVAEFGCGSGHNLKQYGEQYPGKQLQGYDWTPSSVALVRRIPDAVGYLFDMRYPRGQNHSINRTTGVLTCGSMEQLGEGFVPFLAWLAEQRPAVCVHVEPCIELYDERRMFDLTAAMYHRSRGYLGRWIVEAGRRGELLRQHRTGFGNVYNEGYSVVVWRPR